MRSRGMCRWFAVVSTIRSMAAWISSALFSSSHMRSTLFSTAIFCGRPGRTYRSQISRSLLVTPVSIDNRKRIAWAAGMVLTVSSGSMPRAFRPGVSRIDRPLDSSGCG